MNKFEIIRLLSDENRFNIFTKLIDFDGLCVSEIEGLLGIKQANASKHIRRFKDLDMLDSERNKNMIKYRIKDSFIQEHTDLIKYLMF